MTYDTIIVGAGIVGAACAMECTLAGMRVAVVEADVIGGGATAAGMGHIVVMDDSPAQLALTKYSQQLWHDLSPRLPSDVEYEQTGTIWVAADSAEMQEVYRKRDLYEAQDIPARVLDSKELLDAEPNLSPELAGGLFVSSDAVLYPPCAARYLLDRAVDGGAQVIRQKAIRMGNGQVQLATGDHLTSRHLINAAGASASTLTSGLPIRKRKGHLAITDRAPGFLRHQLVELGYIRSAASSTADSVAFNVQPRKTGQVLIGSSRQFDAEEKGVDREILLRMMHAVQRYMPGLDRLSIIRTWTGFRAATPDKLPLIGPHPGDSSLFLATGHEGLGITTSLATGKLLRQILTGSGSEISVEPYLPARALHLTNQSQQERQHA